jgi:molecular chaperone DnaK
VKQPVVDAIAEVKTALEGEDNDAVKAAVDKLNTTSAALGQAMYAAAQAQQAPSEAGAPSDNAEGNGSSASDDDVVDAEIVDDETSGERK